MNLFDLYTTMLRVDVEAEGSVLLVTAKKCLWRPCKNTTWKSPKYPEMTWFQVHVAYPQCAVVHLVVLKQPLTDWHHSSLQGIGYVISKYHSHVHLPLWISMHSKGKLHTVRNGSTLRTKLFMRNFVRSGRNKSWRGSAKPSSNIFRNNLPEISRNTL